MLDAVAAIIDPVAWTDIAEIDLDRAALADVLTFEAMRWSMRRKAARDKAQLILDMLNLLAKDPTSELR